MEVIDAVFAGCLLVLLLALLGVMREVEILRGDIKALTNLVTTSGPPTFLGKPPPLILSERLGWDPAPLGRAVVLFLSDTCSGCENLLNALDPDSHPAFATPVGDSMHVVLAGSAESRLAVQARRLGVDTVYDSKFEIFNACEIRATPTMCLLVSDAQGTLLVKDHTVGGGVEWIHRQFRSETGTERTRAGMTQGGMIA